MQYITDRENLNWELRRAITVEAPKHEAGPGIWGWVIVALLAVAVWVR